MLSSSLAEKGHFGHPECNCWEWEHLNPNEALFLMLKVKSGAIVNYQWEKIKWNLVSWVKSLCCHYLCKCGLVFLCSHLCARAASESHLTAWGENTQQQKKKKGKLLKLVFVERCLGSSSQASAKTPKGSELLIVCIKRTQLRLFGHLLRIPNGCFLLEVYEHGDLRSPGRGIPENLINLPLE